ncbi:MAG: AAA family ATPase [Bacteroidota bacterium]
MISIKNVGRFLNSGASGDVEFKRHNIVFAENGRGKTTLSAIFRSLSSGEPSYIIGRTTLGVSEKPEVKILSDGSVVTFSNSRWDGTVPEIVIFDSTFISEHVYSGDVIDLEQRRNLYGLIIGKRGVELARRIEELDSESRRKSTEIRERRSAVERWIPRGITLEQFLLFAEDPDITRKIGEKERELEALEQAERVKNRLPLKVITLPMFPIEFSTLLQRTVEDIGKDVQRLVLAHLQKHEMQQRGEEWLSEGLGYVKTTACPFCDQSLDGVQLVSAYNAYFSAAYKELVEGIVGTQNVIAKTFGDQEIANLEKQIQENVANSEFWTNYCDLSVLPSIEQLGDTIRGLRDAALNLLRQKALAPVNPLAPNEDFERAWRRFSAIQGLVQEYNSALDVANRSINKKKAEVAANRASTAEEELTVLRSIKTRFDADANLASMNYQQSVEEKRKIEATKDGLKNQLDDHTKGILAKYEHSINRVLDDFNAGFRIMGASHGYPGGVPSATYQIVINEVSVELGDSATPLDRPSFKNTLSAGDRSTIALAFFLAQFEHDAEKSKKILMFDDPFNSQDSFRKNRTIQRIIQCGEESSQTFVLSHDRFFIKRIWDRLDHKAGERKALELARVGVRNTKIIQWDIEQATQPRFNADRKALLKYYTEGRGDPTEIVKKIRPVLETHCTKICPDEFDGDSLGKIIEKVRSAGFSHDLFPVIRDLESANEYTCRYHHGDGSTATSEAIGDGELQGFVKLTLSIIGTSLNG